MPTPKKSQSSDRRRVSSEKHEISYAASKLPKKKRGSATAVVRKAKASLGRTTSRPKVMKKAKQLA